MKKNFDIGFVVDVSGSMSGNEIRMAKMAMESFIRSMQDDDEASVVTFNHYAALKQDFTSDKEALRKAVSLMYASGGTDVNNGLLTALSTYDRHVCTKQKIIVLICDGDVNYVQSTIDRCIAGGIQIYAVNVGYAPSHARLKKMAKQTGGEYYFAATADQIEAAFAGVIGDTTGQIDPTDVDGDGLTDDVDDRPLITNMVEIAKLNSKFSNHYLNIVESNSKSYAGGDQGWWENDVTSDNTMEHQTRLKEDKYYRLWHMGCGTIAMCDAELYLTLQNRGYSLRVPTALAADCQQTGSCQKGAYRDYIEQMYMLKYPIFDVYHGLYPTNMEGGLTNFLMANNCYGKKVKWARYGQFASDTEKQKIADEIARMLNEDIPVVFSYHTFAEGDDIIMYDSLENASTSFRK